MLRFLGVDGWTLWGIKETLTEECGVMDYESEVWEDMGGGVVWSE